MNEHECAVEMVKANLDGITPIMYELLDSGIQSNTAAVLLVQTKKIFCCCGDRAPHPLMSFVLNGEDSTSMLEEIGVSDSSNLNKFIQEEIGRTPFGSICVVTVFNRENVEIAAGVRLAITRKEMGKA